MKEEEEEEKVWREKKERNWQGRNKKEDQTQSITHPFPHSFTLSHHTPSTNEQRTTNNRSLLLPFHTPNTDPPLPFPHFPKPSQTFVLLTQPQHHPLTSALCGWVCVCCDLLSQGYSLLFHPAALCDLSSSSRGRRTTTTKACVSHFSCECVCTITNQTITQTLSFSLRHHSLTPDVKPITHTHNNNNNNDDKHTQITLQNQRTFFFFSPSPLPFSAASNVFFHTREAGGGGGGGGGGGEEKPPLSKGGFVRRRAMNTHKQTRRGVQKFSQQEPSTRFFFFSHHDERPKKIFFRGCQIGT